MYKSMLYEPQSVTHVELSICPTLEIVPKSQGIYLRLKCCVALMYKNDIYGLNI